MRTEVLNDLKETATRFGLNPLYPVELNADYRKLLDLDDIPEVLFLPRRDFVIAYLIDRKPLISIHSLKRDASKFTRSEEWLRRTVIGMKRCLEENGTVSDIRIPKRLDFTGLNMKNLVAVAERLPGYDAYDVLEKFVFYNNEYKTLQEV